MAGLLTNLEPHDSKGRLRKSYVDEEIKAELERLRQENVAQKGASPYSHENKPKGAVSIYGMGCFPVTYIKNNG